MMLFRATFIVSLCTLLASLNAADLERDGVSVKVGSKTYSVKRVIPEECKHIPINNQMLWTEHYASRKVPESCKSTFVHTKGRLLPMTLDHDIETYGELEVLATLKEMKDNPDLLLIDSRNEEWYDYRTIPGAINMPFRYFKYRDDYEFHFDYALKYMGVIKDKEGEYDFDHAKTLVLFCNGPWCSQSPSMIFALIEIGYPPEKIKWYRGGMQDWLSAGMTSTRD
jgi:rhodanese-related sulfurtransferase